jgi:hypothetical protein
VKKVGIPAPAHKSTSQVEQCLEVVGFFLKAHPGFSIALGLGRGAYNNPAAAFFARFHDHRLAFGQKHDEAFRLCPRRYHFAPATRI